MICSNLGASLAGTAFAWHCGKAAFALSAYLGHADAGITLRTYTHLMPSSETRTRKAVDEMYRTARKGPTAP